MDIISASTILCEFGHKRLAVLATLSSQSRVAIQCGDLKHQFNKNQTTNKEGQKLTKFYYFQAENNIFADFKNRFALVCGKFKYAYFETYHKSLEFRRLTFYTKCLTKKSLKGLDPLEM